APVAERAAGGHFLPNGQAFRLARRRYGGNPSIDGSENRPDHQQTNQSATLDHWSCPLVMSPRLSPITAGPAPREEDRLSAFHTLPGKWIICFKCRRARHGERGQ